jgi:hypothetical protein
MVVGFPSAVVVSATVLAGMAVVVSVIVVVLMAVVMSIAVVMIVMVCMAVVMIVMVSMAVIVQVFVAVLCTVPVCFRRDRAVDGLPNSDSPDDNQGEQSNAAGEHERVVALRDEQR